ncbi:ATP-binding cassette domain-containing protein [Magnetococcales bacterium HHB-1]
MEKKEGTALKDFKGEVVLDNVGFAYPGATNPLFESLNVTLKPGSIVAVTGGNGTGKTTLLRILAGLLEPGRGQVMVEGIDQRQLVPEWWRKQLCYLPQEVYFLEGTLRENLTFLNPEIDASKLNKVVESAGLTSFLGSSQKGLDMPLPGGGRELSPGIRKKMALARALASYGPVIIFDEPTESMDQEGARAVYTALNHFLKQERSVLVATQDPLILQAATQVINLNTKPIPQVLKSGKAGSGRGDKRRGGAS